MKSVSYGTKYRFLKILPEGVHQVSSGKFIVRVKKKTIANGRSYGFHITTLKQFDTQRKAKNFYDKWVKENDEKAA